VVWNIFYFHPYLGKIPNLTIFFQMGWNHQLVKFPDWLLKTILSSWWWLESCEEGGRSKQVGFKSSCEEHFFRHTTIASNKSLTSRVLASELAFQDWPNGRCLKGRITLSKVYLDHTNLYSKDVEERPEHYCLLDMDSNVFDDFDGRFWLFELMCNLNQFESFAKCVV